jgi:hypothetical protein
MEEDERRRQLRRSAELAQALRHASDAFDEALQAQAVTITAYETVVRAHQDSLRANEAARWAIGEALRIVTEE